MSGLVSPSIETKKHVQDFYNQGLYENLEGRNVSVWILFVTECYVLLLIYTLIWLSLDFVE